METSEKTRPGRLFPRTSRELKAAGSPVWHPEGRNAGGSVALRGLSLPRGAAGGGGVGGGLRAVTGAECPGATGTTCSPEAPYRGLKAATPHTPVATRAQNYTREESAVSRRPSPCRLSKHSPSIVAGSVGKLLPPHAQTGQRSRGTLVVHVLYTASGHLSLSHKGLTAPRHCKF